MEIQTVHPLKTVLLKVHDILRDEFETEFEFYDPAMQEWVALNGQAPENTYCNYPGQQITSKKPSVQVSSPGTYEILIPIIYQGEITFYALGTLTMTTDFSPELLYTIQRWVHAFAQTLPEQIARLTTQEENEPSSYTMKNTEKTLVADGLAMLKGLALTLMRTLESKHGNMVGHAERVAEISAALAHRLGLSEQQCEDAYLAGLLHDIGKVGVRDDLLRLRRSLTWKEYDLIKKHAQIGYSILADVEGVQHLLPAILHHHERYDGEGYPAQLQGEEIPLLARIIAVADAYDAMSNTQPYRNALSCQEVENRLQEGAGSQWDPIIVQTLLEMREIIHTTRCTIVKSHS